METTTGFIDLSLYYEKHNGYCVEAIYHEVPLPRLRTPIVAKTSFCVLPCGKSGKRLKSEAITLFNLHKAEYAQQCASKFLCKILEEV